MTQLAQECPELEVHIRPIGQLLIPGIAEVVGKLGGPEATARVRAGLALGVADFLDAPQEKLAGRRAASRSLDRVEALRAVKDAGEIAAIREAIDIAERAFAMPATGFAGSATSEEGRGRRARGLPATPVASATSASFPPDHGRRRCRLGTAARPADRPTRTDWRRRFRAAGLGCDRPGGPIKVRDFDEGAWSPVRSHPSCRENLSDRPVGPGRAGSPAIRPGVMARRWWMPKPAPSSRRPVSAAFFGTASATAWD